MSNKFRILKTQAEIADLAGITQAAVSKYINGESVPMPDTAVKLEKATGCCRESWIWPERHWNPYIPFYNEAMTCHKCPFRGTRVKFIMQTALQRFEEKPVRSTFKDLVYVGRVMHGIDREAVIIFREIIAPDYPILASSGPDPFADEPQDVVQWKDEFFKMHPVVVSFPWPLGIVNDGSEYYKRAVRWGYDHDVASALAVSYGRVEFNLLGIKEPIYYGKESVEGTKYFVKEIDRIWKENGYR